MEAHRCAMLLNALGRRVGGPQSSPDDEGFLAAREKGRAHSPTFGRPRSRVLSTTRGTSVGAGRCIVAVLVQAFLKNYKRVSNLVHEKSTHATTKGVTYLR